MMSLKVLVCSVVVVIVGIILTAANSGMAGHVLALPVIIGSFLFLAGPGLLADVEPPFQDTLLIGGLTLVFSALAGAGLVERQWIMSAIGLIVSLAGSLALFLKTRDTNQAKELMVIPFAAAVFTALFSAIAYYNNGATALSGANIAYWFLGGCLIAAFSLGFAHFLSIAVIDWSYSALSAAVTALTFAMFVSFAAVSTVSFVCMLLVAALIGFVSGLVGSKSAAAFTSCL